MSEESWSFYTRDRILYDEVSEISKFSLNLKKKKKVICIFEDEQKCNRSGIQFSISGELTL